MVPASGVYAWPSRSWKVQCVMVTCCMTTRHTSEAVQRNMAAGGQYLVAIRVVAAKTRVEDKHGGVDLGVCAIRPSNRMRERWRAARDVLKTHAAEAVRRNAIAVPVGSHDSRVDRNGVAKSNILWVEIGSPPVRRSAMELAAHAH